MSWYYNYKPTIETDEGIKAKSKRGAFVKNWWATPLAGRSCANCCATCTTPSVWWGGLNTIILVVSTLVIWKAVEAAKAGNAGSAKKQMLITMLLGIIFLGIKGYEYSQKIRHGIYPTASRQLLYEEADFEYLSAVGEHTNLKTPPSFNFLTKDLLYSIPR